MIVLRMAQDVDVVTSLVSLIERRLLLDKAMDKSNLERESIRPFKKSIDLSPDSVVVITYPSHLASRSKI